MPPLFQEPDIVFGQLAGMAMSIPPELKEEDHEIKRPPIVGEWFVVSPTKISRSKYKLLKALGFFVIDMTEWSGKNGPFELNEISRMVASALSGNYHEKPPSLQVKPAPGYDEASTEFYTRH